MRAIRILLLAGGIGFAMAQDSAPSQDNSPSATADPNTVLPTQRLFGGGPVVVVNYGAQGQRQYKYFPGRTEFAGQPTGVCSVRLLEMPIPKDVTFTVRKIHPRPTGDKLYAQAPAPPCPAGSR